MNGQFRVKTANKFIALLIAAALLITLGATVSFWAIEQMKEAAEARAHTQRVISASEGLLSQLRSAESGQRGYALTGDESFLEPYRVGRSRVAGYLEELRQNVQNKTSQAHRAAVAPLIDAKLTLLAQVIVLRRNEQMAALQALVKSGESEGLMDAISIEINALAQIEQDTLAQLEVDFQSSMRRLFFIFLGVSLLALLSIVSFAYLIYSKLQQRFKNFLYVKTRHLLELQEALNSELQQAKKTAVENEEKLAVTLSSIGDAVIATDKEARVTLLNSVAEQLTGWTQAEAIGHPIDEVFHIINKETRQLATTPVMDTLALGTVQGLADHTVLIARDGFERDISDSCAPIRNRDGELLGAVLVFRNVTEEHAVQNALSIQQLELEVQNNELLQSRAALDASQARYFDLYDRAPVGYLTLSESGLIIEANVSAAAMLNLDRAILVKESITRFVDQEDMDIYYRLRQALMATGDPQACELRLRPSTDELLWVHLSISRALDEGMPVLRMMMTDINARKQTEAALLQAGALQRAIFNNANFSSIATDANGVIQIFNVGAERMLGYSATEVMNKITPADICDPQELIICAEVLSAELDAPITPGFEALVFKASRGIEDIYELTYIRKDGGRLPALVSVTALRDEKNMVIGYLLISTDNTARKRFEEERAQLDLALLAKNIELENARIVADEANLAKSDFLSSMSHELRTPLGAILGFAQLIESGTPSPTPSQKRSVDQILKAGWYLLELINEILDLAVIESGKLSLSIESVSLAEVLQECAVMIEPLAEKFGISVVFAKLEQGYFVKADRTRVKQILINLLSNSIKYNKMNGTVTVTCRMTPSDSIQISVRDTGEGISDEWLAQLFQPFNRLGQKANIDEGTGIGLVVCKRLVELMAGEIGVESTVGIGSVFWFKLKLTDQPNLSVCAEDVVDLDRLGNQGGEQKYTLLYVEDNPANLMLVEDIIARRQDIRLLSASDGRSGIELARTAQPDVILMDINLPGISGIGALKILSNDAFTAHIPVVALSANAMPHDIVRGLAAGFVGYLTKPIKIIEFMQTLDAALKIADTKRGGTHVEEV